MRKTVYSCLGLGAWILAGAVCLHAELERIDVRVESIRISPDRPSADLPLTVNAVLRNHGSDQASGIFITVEIMQGRSVFRRISDVPVLSELPSSGAGISIPVALGSLPEGDYRANVWAASQNKTGQSGEDLTQASMDFPWTLPSF